MGISYKPRGSHTGGHGPPEHPEDNARVDERAPWTRRRPETEQRKMNAELLYELEMEFRKMGWGDPALVYDEEKDLFRFVDGRFAFSREHADWDLLRKRGRLKGR
jgi:hypothetical protein